MLPSMSNTPPSFASMAEQQEYYADLAATTTHLIRSNLLQKQLNQQISALIMGTVEPYTED